MTSRTDPVAARAACALAVSATLLSACGGDDHTFAAIPAAPAVATSTVTVYSATAAASGVPGTTAATQDLLTGGLGKTGIGGAAPAYANPLIPTALELRRNAIHSNYRAIVDASAGGGYGSLYGPNVDITGTATAGEGLIPAASTSACWTTAAARRTSPSRCRSPTASTRRLRASCSARPPARAASTVRSEPRATGA